MPEMKTMLLLTERAEPANPVSSNMPPVTIHEGDATLSCTCDLGPSVSRVALAGTEDTRDRLTCARAEHA